MVLPRRSRLGMPRYCANCAFLNLDDFAESGSGIHPGLLVSFLCSQHRVQEDVPLLFLTAILSGRREVGSVLHRVDRVGTHCQCLPLRGMEKQHFRFDPVSFCWGHDLQVNICKMRDHSNYHNEEITEEHLTSKYLFDRGTIKVEKMICSGYIEILTERMGKLSLHFQAGEGRERCNWLDFIAYSKPPAVAHQ